jgi:hypothetical protein
VPIDPTLDRTAQHQTSLWGRLAGVPPGSGGLVTRLLVRSAPIDPTLDRTGQQSSFRLLI